MIRSRSIISIPPASNTSDRDNMSMNNSGNVGLNSRQYPGGTKLWKFLIVVLMGGMITYIALIVSSPSQIGDRLKHTDISKEKITVVMNTFRRYDMMQDAVEYYSSCELIKYIYIVWSEHSPPPQRISAKYSSRQHPQVSFLIQSSDSLNNRFKPITLPHTDSIFSVDDDMRVPCGDLKTALEVWTGSQQSLVGFMPRLHLRGKKGKLVYRCWWRVWWHGAYSIILTKAALLHHNFFELYTTMMPQSIRDFVDKSRNCEDIAMQFLMSNITSLPPIYVKGHVDDLGPLNGISTSKSVISAQHMDKRSECLNVLAREFGWNPLLRSHIIVDSAHNGWVNSPSTWWEYISSDLWNWK